MAAAVFVAKHYSGTASTTPAKVTLGRRGHHIVIKNLDGTNLLKISFDGGRNFFTLQKGETLNFDVAFHYFYVLSDANAAWCALVSEG